MLVDAEVTSDLSKHDISSLEDAGRSLLGENITSRYPFDFSHGSALITIDWYSPGVQESLTFLKQKKSSYLK